MDSCKLKLLKKIVMSLEYVWYNTRTIKLYCGKGDYDIDITNSLVNVESSSVFDARMIISTLIKIQKKKKITASYRKITIIKRMGQKNWFAKHGSYYSCNIYYTP